MTRVPTNCIAVRSRLLFVPTYKSCCIITKQNWTWLRVALNCSVTVQLLEPKFYRGEENQTIYNYQMLSVVMWWLSQSTRPKFTVTHSHQIENIRSNHTRFRAESLVSSDNTFQMLYTRQPSWRWLYIRISSNDVASSSFYMAGVASKMSLYIRTLGRNLRNSHALTELNTLFNSVLIISVYPTTTV